MIASFKSAKSKKRAYYSVDLHSVDIISSINQMSFTYSALNQVIMHLIIIKEIITIVILMARLLMVANLGYY